MIETEKREDGVVVLTLAHGKANVMDLELCTVLAERFEALADAPPPALVVTGTGRTFSAGVDLGRLLDGGADYVVEFRPSLDRMLQSLLDVPCPVVAAVNGHAIAGGCLLACAADRRLMANGSGRVGLPELRVGVPFPPLALELARSVIRQVWLQRLISGGETLDPETAETAGLVDERVDVEHLVDRAAALAASLTSIGAPAYALTKAMLQQPLRDRTERSRETFAERVDALWGDPATFEAVRAFVTRTMGKG
ncbi:MAG: enoyl-CoA hydratase/isomerase family protein [Gammaproteobacteria bacterium]|nr:enoyl-CoA hydratase/isomerase family protein [Gammaproteobacteria bacterium]